MEIVLQVFVVIVCLSPVPSLYFYYSCDLFLLRQNEQLCPFETESLEDYILFLKKALATSVGLRFASVCFVNSVHLFFSFYTATATLYAKWSGVLCPSTTYLSNVLEFLSFSF